MPHSSAMHLLVIGMLGPVFMSLDIAEAEQRFAARTVYQAPSTVYGLAWGEFDSGHTGNEVACHRFAVTQTSEAKGGGLVEANTNVLSKVNRFLRNRNQWNAFYVIV